MATTSAILWPGMMWGSIGEIAERGAAPLEAVGLGAAVGDQVAADLAARAFHPRVAFALGHAHLPHRLHARARGDRPLGQAVERLARMAIDSRNSTIRTR